MAKANRKTFDATMTFLGIIVTALLIVVGVITWWGASFAKDQVRTELASQKIYFPPKGSPALDPKEFPDLQQYAGQLVDNGPKAKAYANGFIGRHLKNIANGQTYAEVSSKALADPKNQALQGQKQALFQGETLRGLLLEAYSFWTFGMLAQWVSVASLIGAGVMAVLTWMGLMRIGR